MSLDPPHGKGLGYRKPELPDPGNQNFPLTAALRRIDTRRRRKPWRTGPIRDQGQTGTCVGHGLRAWYEAEPRFHDAIFGPQPFDIYAGTCPLDEWGENDAEVAQWRATGDPTHLQFGTSVHAAIKYAQAIKWLGPDDRYFWVPQELPKGASADMMADFLTRMAGGPIVIGVSFYAGMDEYDADGVVSVSGALWGGHCMCVVWFDHKRGLFKVQQSWGTRTGLNGFIYVPAEGMDQLAREGGEMATIVEAKKLRKVA